MADDIDRAQAREQADREAAIKQAARALPTGKAGECDLCGEHSMRLVDGACAPCRDRYKLP